jgi:hypothetical protein
MSIETFSLLLLGAMAVLALRLIVAWALVLFSWLGGLWDVLLTWLHSSRLPAAPPKPAPAPAPAPAPGRLRVPPAAAATVPIASAPSAPRSPAEPAESEQIPMPANDFHAITASIADEMRERADAHIHKRQRLLTDLYAEVAVLVLRRRAAIALQLCEDEADYQDTLRALRRSALMLFNKAIPFFEELGDQDMVQELHCDIAEALAVYAKHVTND